MRKSIIIGDVTIKAGQRVTVDLDVPDLYTHTGISLPVHVIHGKNEGPVLFLSAALHGDEINGVEIIRRILKDKRINNIRGTLLAVPVVNIYGFINQTRYLPDRRDLNRSFPGSETGSLAARMANVFLQEIVSKCTHGIDLHTAAVHRDNLPHVRAVMDDPETERIARAFELPVILNTSIVEGSLRKSAEEAGITVIVYEAGEALRFNEASIRGGTKGAISVMREIGMLPKLKKPKIKNDALVAQSSTWIRASQSGILRTMKTLGAWVQKEDLLGIISDPFGEKEEHIHASVNGIIIGRTNIPLVNEGEALFHIARYKSPDEVAEQVEVIQNTLNPATDELKPAEPPIV
ncbi:MAG: succinylglutamate desuccinylase/aspartoacylase family protein [Gammaproteobacteria bacterium]